jgi:tRNA threonylcarbamoyladenosine biosynthesis protein TsaE
MATARATSRGAADTERAAERVAARLAPGDVVLISGEVGVGKTTFVRAACRALGVRERVTSPSFTIGHRYAGTFPISHVDLFRLDTLAGEEPGLLSDYLTDDAVAFVEWPEAASPEIEPQRVALDLRLWHRGGDTRGVQAEGHESLVEALTRALAPDTAAR